MAAGLDFLTGLVALLICKPDILNVVAGLLK